MKKRAYVSILAAVLAVSTLAGCGSSSTTAQSSSAATSSSASSAVSASSSAAESVSESTSSEAASATSSVATSEENSDVPEGDVTLTFWSPTWHQDADEAVIADFEKKYPNIKIEPTFYSTADIKTATKVAASSNTLPDMWYNWGGANYANYYAAAGLTYDLTDYAKEHDWENKFISSALDLCKYNDQIIALPQVYTGLILWYRKDIFDQLGLSVPQTMDEFENVCATLKENGIVPMSTGGQFIFRYVEPLLEYYAGPEEHDALNSLDADWSQSEAVTKAFTKLKEWADKGYFIDGAVTEDPANCKMYVYSGTAAMVMDNSSVASEVVANDYDPSQYGYFALPVTDDPAKPGRISAYVKTTQFNKNLTDDQFKAAMLFWDYYLSEESIKAHPTIEQPTAINGAPLSDDLALANGLLELIDTNGSYMTTDQNLPSEVMDVIFAEEDSVFLGEDTPEQAASKIQDAATAYKAANK